MERIETKKLLPALERGYQRALLKLQGEWMGQRVDALVWVDFELLTAPSLNVEADDIAVIGVWSEAGDDLLGGYGEELAADMPAQFAYLYGCAQRAAAGHVYAVEVEDLDESRARRADRMLTGAL